MRSVLLCRRILDACASRRPDCLRIAVLHDLGDLPVTFFVSVSLPSSGICFDPGRRSAISCCRNPTISTGPKIGEHRILASWTAKEYTDDILTDTTPNAHPAQDRRDPLWHTALSQLINSVVRAPLGGPPLSFLERQCVVDRRFTTGNVLGECDFRRNADPLDSLPTLSEVWKTCSCQSCVSRLVDKHHRQLERWSPPCVIDSYHGRS